MEERSDSDTRSKERTVARKGEKKKKKRKKNEKKDNKIPREIFPLFTYHTSFLFIAVNEKLIRFRLE